MSEYGTSGATFPCDAAGDGQGRYVGCAGWTPTLEYDPAALLPLDPDQTEGDAFDLAEVGLAQLAGGSDQANVHDLLNQGERD